MNKNYENVITVYALEGRNDGDYILNRLMQEGVDFLYVPMTGLPEINIGLKRFSQSFPDLPHNLEELMDIVVSELPDKNH